MAKPLVLFWLMVLLASCPAQDQDLTLCPQKCQCKVQRQQTWKVECVNQGIDSVASLHLPLNTTQLTITGNSINKIAVGELSSLVQLERLNLSNNNIAEIESGAFRRLTALTRLDLSLNNLVVLNGSMLDGLSRLERLSLSGNKFATLPEKIFTPLTSLKRIDFQTDQLFCDCRLKWMFKWIRDTKVTVVDTKCVQPSKLRSITIQEISRDDLHCDWPVDVKVFEVHPSSTQLVFEGDNSVPFECTVSNDSPLLTVNWLREDRIVITNGSAGISVTEDKEDPKLIKVTLRMEKLSQRSSGVWNCLVQTPQGNVTKSVNVMVATAYCPEVKMDTRKGQYVWPRTVADIRSSLPCNDGDKGSQAFNNCNQKGKWVDLDLSECKYSSGITQALEEFSKMDYNTSNQIKHAERLSVMLTNPRDISDKMDVIFIARVVQKISSQSQHYGSLEITQMVLNITSLIMNVNGSLLWEAQKDERACSSMIESLKRAVATDLKTKKEVKIYADNIAVEGRQIEGRDFIGLTCTAVQSSKTKYLPNNFYCDHSATKISLNQLSNQKVDALMHLPKEIVDPSISFYRVTAIVYRNAQLFRRLGHTDAFVVPGAVISANFDGLKIENLEEPVVVVLPVQRSEEEPTLRAVSWNQQMSDWSSEHCSIQETASHGYANLSLVHCTRLADFALLREEKQPVNRGLVEDMFILMRPQFYIGAMFLCICLLATVFTYICAYRSISLSKKLKHALVNTCISILLLKLVFILGVKMKLSLACKIMGVAIHYFSICTVFWMTVTSWNIYKKINRKEKSIPPPEEGVAPLPPNPMLKFYLFAWGVPVIICGITGAVNINFYNNPDYCFVAWKPGLLAFYGVIGLFMLINCILFICICSAKGSADKVSAEEIVRLNTSMEEATPPENGSNIVSIKSSEADVEYKPLTQMAGLILFIVLYVLMWASAAFSIAVPFDTTSTSMDTVLSYLYMMLCILLGMFIIVFYCFARNDTRKMWKSCSSTEHANSADTQAQNSLHILTKASDKLLCHDSSTESEQTMKSGDVTNPLMRIMQYNRKATMMSQAEPTSDLTAGDLNEEGPLFYNPRQNGVARKYWEKKRNSSKDMHSLGTCDGHAHHGNHTRSPAMTDPGNANVSVEIRMQSHHSKQARRQRLGSANSEPSYVHNNIYHSMPKSLPTDKRLIIKSQVVPVSAKRGPYTHSPVQNEPQLAFPYPPQDWQRRINTAFTPYQKPSAQASVNQYVQPQPGYIKQAHHSLDESQPRKQSRSAVDSTHKQALLHSYIHSTTPSHHSDEESRHSHRSRHSLNRPRHRHKKHDSTSDTRLSHQSHRRSRSRSSVQSQNTSRSHRSSRSHPSHRNSRETPEGTVGHQSALCIASPETPEPVDSDADKLNIHHSSSDNNSSHYACVRVIPENKLTNNQTDRCDTPSSSSRTLSLKRTCENSCGIPEERIYENAPKIELPTYENLETLRQNASLTQTSDYVEYELPVYENIFSMVEYDTLSKQKCLKVKGVTDGRSQTKHFNLQSNEAQNCDSSL